MKTQNIKKSNDNNAKALSVFTAVVIFSGFSVKALANETKSSAASAACATAKVDSGDTCSNVKVLFSFDACETKREPVFAKRIVCVKETIKARFQDDSIRYEAQFEKQSDGWGGVSWKSLGPVNQMVMKEKSTSTKNKMAVAPAVAPEPKPEFWGKPAETQPMAVKAEPAVEAIKQEVAEMKREISSESSPFKLGGFIDFRFANYVVPKDSPDVATANAESGFILEDGAFQASYEKDKVSVTLDVPFRRALAGDATKTGAQYNAGNVIVFGADKTQAFGKYKAASNFTMYLGQFDTLFGVELNDSKDRVFGKTGLVYDLTLPVVHSGVMAEVGLGSITTKLFAANPNNKVSYGTSSSNDATNEYGVAFSYSSDMFRGQVGGMTRLIDKLGQTTQGQRTLIDVIVGGTFGSLSVDLEYNQLTDPTKNTLTAAATDTENAGVGILGLINYKFSDEFSAGVRIERVTDDPVGGSSAGVKSFKTADSQGLSLAYKLAPEATFKTEFTGYKYKNTADKEWSESRIYAGAVFSL